MKLKLGIISTLGILVAVPAITLSTAYASSTTGSTTSTTNPSPSSTTAADNISNIITKGNNEITRRLSTLSRLDTLISSSTKLSSADKTTLTNEVNSETSGLTSLKATLDACTTKACVHTNATDIFSDYRLYALVVPQIRLMSTADHQQQVEAGLNQIESQLSSRVTSTSSSSLQSDLATLKSDITAAQGLSSSVETSVVALQPTDYNSNHTVLVQYQNNLKTAAKDNQSSISEVKTILKDL